jgi:hypothetical protein
MALGEAGVVGPDGPEPRPSAIGTFRSGSAKITLGPGQTVLLDHLAAPASLDAAEPASLRWSGPDGWSLEVEVNGALGPIGASSPMLDADAIVDHVAGNVHRTTAFGGGCNVTFSRAAASGVDGSASCVDLRWFDAIGMFGGFANGEPSPLPDPPFDLELTFSARP